MLGSSESWEPQQAPRRWHSRAGGGAVHSIKSGLMQCSKMQHSVNRFRATAPTSPTNDANDLLTSNSLSKRDASVLGSPKASSGNLRASARSQTGISRSNSKDRNSGLSPKGRSMRISEQDRPDARKAR